MEAASWNYGDASTALKGSGFFANNMLSWRHSVTPSVTPFFSAVFIFFHPDADFISILSMLLALFPRMCYNNGSKGQSIGITAIIE